jgi:D-3-phosphoglycerate dehydrogenase / 2-oxoglutarate reductase
MMFSDPIRQMIDIFILIHITFRIGIMSGNNVLISTSTFGVVSREPEEMLITAGFQPVYNPHGRKLNKEELITLAADCVGVVAGTETWDLAVMQVCPKLKVISRVGVGMDNVDLEAARELGIIVRNTPFGPTRAVSELTLALTMSLLRKVPQSHLNLKKGTWKKETGRLLAGKKIGIIGLGRIGKETALIFRALENEVYACDPFFDREFSSAHNVHYQDMNDLLGVSDIVILHLPASSDKSAVIAERELKLMKENALLVNVSRGGVVDEEDLFNALKNKTIGGAAIDVFLEEPYVNGPLCGLDNVVLTPHIGSYAAESKLQMEKDAVKHLLEVLTDPDKL